LRISGYQVPEVRLPDLIDDVKRLYQRYQRNIFMSPNKSDEVAQLLGHKSCLNGRYLNKISALKMYGLLDGKSDVKVTELGYRIISANEATSSQAYFEAAMRIPLWRALYSRYLLEPPGDLSKDLAEITSCDESVAKANESFVRNLYEEDTRSIKVPKYIEVRVGADFMKARLTSKSIDEAIHFLLARKPIDSSNQSIWTPQSVRSQDRQSASTQGSSPEEE
jgi:hypothetical protein